MIKTNQVILRVVVIVLIFLLRDIFARRRLIKFLLLGSIFPWAAFETIQIGGLLEELECRAYNVNIAH